MISNLRKRLFLHLANRLIFKSCHIAKIKRLFILTNRRFGKINRRFISTKRRFIFRILEDDCFFADLPIEKSVEICTFAPLKATEFEKNYFYFHLSLLFSACTFAKWSNNLRNGLRQLGIARTACQCWRCQSFKAHRVRQQREWAILS